MKQRDNNLTKFFCEYLTQRVESKAHLSASSITMACYSAMNELDTDINIAEVVSDMRSDFDYILEVLDNMARGLFKEQKISKSGRQADKPGELYTINEIACLYPISSQAIRQACRNGRLSYTPGYGKDKYLISKPDIELYMKHAKGKNFNNSNS